MPADQFAKTALDRSAVELAFDKQSARDVVGSGTAVYLMQNPQPFLSVRYGVMIGVRHPRDHVVAEFGPAADNSRQFLNRSVSEDFPQCNIDLKFPLDSA